MSNVAEQIGGLAATAIMVLVLLVVLGTLWGETQVLSVNYLPQV